MSNIAGIEHYVQDPSLLVELCREVIERLDAGSGNEETHAMEAQLREIARAIDKLDKQRIPIPEAFRAEKTRLAAALGVNTEALQMLTHLADELEELLKDLKARIGGETVSEATKNPGSKGPKSPKTSRAVLRSLIIDGLIQLGGSAQKNDLYQEIQKNHKDNFLPGDFDYLPDGKRIVWKNYCDWEGTLMRKEGLLKADSPRGIWELSEDHR